VALFARDKPKMRELIDPFYAYLKSKDPEGREMGAQVQFPAEFNGGQKDVDPPLLSLERARVWNVLRGSYLADKGFLIHDMLARYSAGLYKPPTRLKGQVQLTDDEARTTMKVANMRIHVERDMRRGREFHLLNKTIPISHIDLASAEARVAFFMGNFQPPLTGKDFFNDEYY
jgi:hypothetical protein